MRSDNHDSRHGADTVSQVDTGTKVADGMLEDDLPPELEVLAYSLHRQAGELADTYQPSADAGVFHDPGRAASFGTKGRATRWYLVGSLVASAAALISGFWLVAPASPDANAKAHRIGSSLTESTDATATIGEVHARPNAFGPRIAEHRNRVDRSGENRPEAGSTMFIYDLSGPELEGWLDLRGSQTTNRDHVSL